MIKKIKMWSGNKVQCATSSINRQDRFCIYNSRRKVCELQALNTKGWCSRCNKSSSVLKYIKPYLNTHQITPQYTGNPETAADLIVKLEPGFTQLSHTDYLIGGYRERLMVTHINSNASALSSGSTDID